MKTAIALIAACAFLTGCVVVPSSACALLEIAHEEAQLAPAWYIEAGRVLEACRKPDARAKAELRACYADRWNGYKTTEECEAIE